MLTPKGFKMSNFASGMGMGFLNNPMAMSAYMRGKADATTAAKESNTVSNSSNPMSGINDIYAQMNRDANDRRRDSVLQATYEANRGLFPLVQDRKKTDRINERRRNARIGKKSKAQMERDERSRDRTRAANADKKNRRAERDKQREADLAAETQRLIAFGPNTSAAAVAAGQADKNESLAYQEEQDRLRAESAARAEAAAVEAERIKAEHEAGIAQSIAAGENMEPQGDIDDQEAYRIADEVHAAQQAAMEAERRRQERVAALQTGQLTPEQIEVGQAGAAAGQASFDQYQNDPDRYLGFIDPRQDVSRDSFYDRNFFTPEERNVPHHLSPQFQESQEAIRPYMERMGPGVLRNVGPAARVIPGIAGRAAPPPRPASSPPPRPAQSPPSRPAPAGPALPSPPPYGRATPMPGRGPGLPRPTVAPPGITHPSHYLIRGRDGVTKVGTQGMSPTEMNMLRIKSARDGLL